MVAWMEKKTAVVKGSTKEPEMADYSATQWVDRLD
jgi:hypothetical protein